jgi:hypothetical protein
VHASTWASAGLGGFGGAADGVGSGVGKGVGCAGGCAAVVVLLDGVG